MLPIVGTDAIFRMAPRRGFHGCLSLCSRGNILRRCLLPCPGGKAEPAIREGLSPPLSCAVRWPVAAIDSKDHCMRRFVVRRPELNPAHPVLSNKIDAQSGKPKAGVLLCEVRWRRGKVFDHDR